MLLARCTDDHASLSSGSAAPNKGAETFAANRPFRLPIPLVERLDPTMARVTLESLDDLPESLQDVRERIRRHRGNAESLHTLGAMLAARGEFRRSFVCHCAAAACRPEEPQYLYHCASIALSTGQADAATSYLDKTLSIDPNHVAAWQARGQLYAEFSRCRTKLCSAI